MNQGEAEANKPQKESETPTDSDELTWSDISEEIQFERESTPKELKNLGESIDHKREDTRTNLALRLIWLLIGTYIVIAILGAIVIFREPKDSERRYTYSKDLFSLLITTQTGLVGTVIGFYFGINQGNKSRDG